MHPAQATAAVAVPTKPIPAKVDVDYRRGEVPLEDEGGTFVVPVTINDAIALKFTIDSGAADVTIPSDVASTLVRAGTISAADYVGSKTFVLADGSEVPSPEFRIRSLRVGTLVLHDVVASISNDKGSLLLGQSFLTRLKGWSIDNTRHVLILNGEARPDLAYNTAPDVPVAAATAVDTATAEDNASNSVSTAAENTVEQYFAAWSNPADADGQSVRQFYGQAVDYYGRALTLDQVMGEKLRFARRWPSRSYAVRRDSLQTQCSVTGTCKVVGLVDWKAGSEAASRYSTGTATFSLMVADGQIVSEHSRVISRG